MKKLFFFLAAITVAFTANAKVINGTPNPGEDGLLDWWVNGADQAGAGGGHCLRRCRPGLRGSAAGWLPQYGGAPAPPGGGGLPAGP